MPTGDPFPSRADPLFPQSLPPCPEGPRAPVPSGCAPTRSASRASRWGLAEGRVGGGALKEEAWEGGAWGGAGPRRGGAKNASKQAAERGIKAQRDELLSKKDLGDWTGLGVIDKSLVW